MDTLQQHIFSGEYLLGDSVSLLDCSLAPKLYHLDAAVGKFHPEARKKLLEECPAVKEYSDRIFQHEAFKATKYDPAVVEWGWTEAREAAAKGAKACGV